MTDAVYNQEIRKEAKICTAKDLKQFFGAVKRNLDVFTQLVKQYDQSTEASFNQLESIENDLTLFTYEKCGVGQYKENTVGECVVTRAGDIFKDRCHINDLIRYFYCSF